MTTVFSPPDDGEAALHAASRENWLLLRDYVAAGGARVEAWRDTSLKRSRPGCASRRRDAMSPRIGLQENSLVFPGPRCLRPPRGGRPEDIAAGGSRVEAWTGTSLKRSRFGCASGGLTTPRRAAGGARVEACRGPSLKRSRLGCAGAGR